MYGTTSATEPFVSMKPPSTPPGGSPAKEQPNAGLAGSQHSKTCGCGKTGVFGASAQPTSAESAIDWSHCA